MSEPLLLEKSGAVASITFNRPDKANAMDTAWFAPLVGFLDEVERDPALRCVLIRGNGKHFMAGGDLELLQSLSKLAPAERGQAVTGSIRDFNGLARRMRSLPKPIVASVQGGIAGSAVGLVAACDIVIAADNAFFFLAHVNLGCSNDGLATYFLPRQIGARKTLEMALLGEKLPAAEALRLGLVNAVVPAAQLGAETEKLVARLAAGPTRAYGLIKTLVDASQANDLDAQGELEARCYEAAASGEDFVEGVSSVLEKRLPRFGGR